MNDLPIHGGDLAWASAHFGIASCDWLDLSTGISPWSWPVVEWPAHVFRALPPPSLQTLQLAAAQYYNCPPQCVLPVPGSQFAISMLPTKLPPSTVAVPTLGYQEHAWAWSKAGHRILRYDNIAQVYEWLSRARVTHVVLINPNNPSGARLPYSEVCALQQALDIATDGRGLLVIDEAFMDCDPANSLTSEPLSNTVVLRSFGKFFGLAGVRLGFVIDHSRQYLALLAGQTGPWTISHPAVWVAEQALQDRRWVEVQCQRIQDSSAQLHRILEQHLDRHRIHVTLVNGGLFVTVRGPAPFLYQQFVQLAKQAVLVRYGELDERESWLRFGLSDCYATLGDALGRVSTTKINCSGTG